MNIVKGVADLLRRSSGSQAGEGSPWGQGDRFSAPAPSMRICFGDVGEEAVLKSLWQRYENAIDKMEKRKLLQVFLMQFIQTYKNWEPDKDPILESMPMHASSEHVSRFQGLVIGCLAGHPSEVILILIQELARITALITDMSSTPTESSPDLAESLSFSVEGLYILNSLDIITRSVHNCRVFSYYGGVQKVIALLKAAVVQLKTLTSALVIDERLSNISTEKTRVLQKMLVYVVSIIFSFTDLNLSGHGKTLYSDNIKHSFSTNWEFEVPNRTLKGSISEASAPWQQKATVLVMEAGGLNWLVELLRVIRRLNLKEQWTELSLQYLTLGTLRSALFQNPRAQNHFRCIGGLEVLLDGLGFPSSNYLMSKVEFLSDNDRSDNYLFGIFQLQILSLEVLRESMYPLRVDIVDGHKLTVTAERFHHFGNMNNLQFLCENGRVHKFANSICWPAFMFQEFRQGKIDSSSCHSHASDLTADIPRKVSLKEPSSHDQSDSSGSLDWNLYAVKLSRALYSFLLPPEDIKVNDMQISVTHISLPVSLAYCELSAKWIMKVLFTVFPCIKACSTENEFPNHLRILANTLQHHTLHAFKKLLVSAPALLDIFREEGIWEFIFSEKFFYFGPAVEEAFMETSPSKDKPGRVSISKDSLNQLKPSNVDTLHMEVISFVEFAATLQTNKHNMPECSALLDALEQSAWNPQLSSILLKTVHRIMQLAFEQTVASFRALDAVARILRVTCIQAQEYRKLGSSISVGHEFGNQNIQSKHDTTEPMEATKAWVNFMETSMDLFTEYLFTADDGRSLIMHNAICVDCLFDLFWEERLRSRVLGHILSLMKLPPTSAKDQIAKLQLCSKYLETFTRTKEREKCFAELSVDLLVGMKDVLLTDRLYYQTLFREGECFLHIVSLLNGSLDEETGEWLVLNVLETLTLLLCGNDASKAAFRALVGAGYQTLQSLLLDFFQCRPSMRLLNALLDMLVDGKFDDREIPMIKNEDAILLFLNVLQKSSDSLQHYGLDILQKLLHDSIPNRTSCFKAGVLSFLLDWFPQKENFVMIAKISQLIQVIGGHSVTGKDMRKIFTLLRSERTRSWQNHCPLLVYSIGAMLREKGPMAFFEFNGFDSGIVIKTPVQWPYNKGFSFTCWVRVENFPAGTMGLFCFLTDNGRGCLAMLGKDKLIFESINQKKQCISLPLTVFSKRWHFLCIIHSIGRAFSGGSILRCYIDGDLVSSEKCRYPRVSDTLTCCTIGTNPMARYEENSQHAVEETFPFVGQMGPSYLFGDALSSDQVKGIYCLGPSYMYSYAANEFPLISNKFFPNGVFDAKDGISTKVIFGLNAQASNGRTLFNVSSTTDRISEKNSFEAIVMDGTQLCSRRLLQDIIYCVGGVSVFFPLLAQMDTSEADNGVCDYMLVKSDTRDKVAADVIELITSVLDDNLANQQQMRLLSGFSILGILFQSVPLQQLNMDTILSLKRMLHVLRNSGIPELVKDAISCIYLNPNIWVFAEFKVQRELYMLLIHHFEKDLSLLTTLCGLPQILDMIHNFYWDKADGRSSSGRKPLLHFTTRQVIRERPAEEEIHKIRLLLLSLAEMSLRQRISATDIKALISFLEKSKDMLCIEDVLHMIMRALSRKPLLSSFLEQVDVLGGCHVFINLLQREVEPIRLLALQFLGVLMVGIPSEKKGPKFFNLSVGRSKSLSESNRKEGNTRVRPILLEICDRLFKFPLSDHLCATLFDVLLGGASPKQVLLKQSRVQQNWNKTNHSGSSSHFLLPQVLVLIFKFMESCKDITTREKILRDLLDLLDSNPSNIEALMDIGWSSWLETSVKLDAFRDCGTGSEVPNGDCDKNEQMLVRNLFCIVLSHYIFSVRGGWHQLEETVNFLLLRSEQRKLSSPTLLRHIFEDLIASLIEVASEENFLLSQPCRDNTLYLLKLLDEMLISESGDKLPFPAGGLYTVFPSDSQESESQKDISIAVGEILNSEGIHRLPRITWSNKSFSGVDAAMGGDWWNLYDSIWVLISEMNGKGSNKFLDKASTLGGPSLGQRARGLVESLNIPAAEVASVVSGGIGGALGGKSSKHVDKAMLLRGEKCPRVVFRLVILYICGAALEKASRCVQQFIDLLPALVSSDDEQNKNRVQLFIWSLLTARSHYGMLDDGARFHIITQFILEIVNCSKSLLSASILGRDDTSDAWNNEKESVSILGLIQRERILIAVADEMRYVKGSKSDRLKQLQGLRIKIDELCLAELNDKKALEDEIETNMNAILASDDSRRAAYQLAYDEDQQIAAERWIHMLRTLIDERGPWSANPFPNDATKHWKLDKTEDSLRRRPKLRRNYHFDEKLCHPPATNQLQPGHPIMESYTALGSLPEQMKHFLRKGACGIAEEGRSETCEDANNSGGLVASGTNDSLESQGSENPREHKGLMDVQDKNDSTSSLIDAETNKVVLSIPCVLITPKRKLAGHLAIMRDALHFSSKFLVEGTGGLSIFKYFHIWRNDDPSKQSHKGPENVGTDCGKGLVDITDPRCKNIKQHRRWNICKVKAVHWTRYLLQYTAIEIFFNDSTAPVFLNFASSNDAKDVGTLIVSSRNESLFPKGSPRDKGGIISFIDRRVAVEMAETARESWRRREISNFEYLMILNTLAGRSYNDLTQYPIFPWVLADYSSEKLDFNKSSSFRDLSKPVGALDLKRFQVFEDRYHSFCDPDIPSFYYGSHYSSMGIVLFYLLRLEPFTALHRTLQGGKFDHADRLFQSIEGTYRNCLSNTSDVKELIPEFFYMPEFLVNSNSYHLGVKQDGEPLNDVSLPPWAKGSPEEFVYRNREALESEFVSSNLHHWIDLIFGYKQRGKPAIEAANVFYYLTYEGAVDLEMMDDELQRSAIEDQIANFGQTPIQLFRKKHPRRGPPIPIAHPLYFAPASITLTSIISPTTQSPSPVLFLDLLDSNIIIVNKELTLSVKMWLTTQLQSGGNFTFSSAQDPFFGIGSDILPPRKIGTPVAENFENGRQCFATIQTPSENYLISCGNWENSFQVASLNDGKTIQSVRQHKDLVSCVSVTSDGSILATGSYDTTVMLWEIFRGGSREKRVSNAQAEFPRKDHVIDESPFHILCGHDDVITCLFVSTELNIVISGSKDATCVFHTLREGRYVRSIQHPSGCALSKLVASQNGRVVIYAENDLSLHMYSINGKHITSSESNGRLNCIELSSCGEFLVCAGDHGQILLRSMYSLEVVRKYEGIGKILTSLVVTPEECFLAGTKDGSLLVYSIENPQLRRGSLPRNTKAKASATG